MFSEGNATMKDLLGGKGANLAEMTQIGLKVPPGFTVSTAACNLYRDNNGEYPVGLWDQVKASLKHFTKTS